MPRRPHKWHIFLNVNACVRSSLLRAFAHCKEVRDLLAAQVRTVHHSRQGVKQQDLVGGCALSLDLSQAFDRLPRQLVVASLRDAQIPVEMINLVIAWHTGSQFHISHGRSDSTIAVHQGIRQGCVLALYYGHVRLCSS